MTVFTLYMVIWSGFIGFETHKIVAFDTFKTIEECEKARQAALSGMRRSYCKEEDSK